MNNEMKEMLQSITKTLEHIKIILEDMQRCEQSKMNDDKKFGGYVTY